MAAPHRAPGQPQAPGQPREWDAASYDALPLPHERWGQRLLATLPLCGDETVLDVGAGTGRDTAALLERLPDGHLIAVDGSAAMLARLRERLAGTGPDRLTVLRADLTAPLELDRPVDAVFSVATLHWLPDHEAVFRSLAGVLRPGGVLRAEWGGAGNCASVETALADLGLPPLTAACNFASAAETHRRLTAAGLCRRRRGSRTRPGLAPARPATGSLPGDRGARLRPRIGAGGGARGSRPSGGGATAGTGGGLRAPAGFGVAGSLAAPTGEEVAIIGW